jgi:hypothetical protein
MNRYNSFWKKAAREFLPLETHLLYKMEDKMSRLDRSVRMRRHRHPWRLFNQTARPTCYALFYPNKLSYLRWRKPGRYVPCKTFNVQLASQVGFPVVLANKVSTEEIFNFMSEKSKKGD